METKNFRQKFDNLERQIEELTYLVATLWKNQNPPSFIQKREASPWVNEKSSSSGEHIRASLFINHIHLVIPYFILVAP